MVHNLIENLKLATVDYIEDWGGGGGRGSGAQGRK